MFGVALGTKFGAAVTLGRSEELFEVPIVAIGALVAAGFVARWLGTRRGLLTGMGLAASLWAAGAGGLERLSDVCVWAGIAAFGLAHVPGSMKRVDRPWIHMVFWGAAGASLALSGAVGPTYLFTVCGIYLLAAQDRNGLRFLFDWHGVASFLAVMAGLAVAQHFGLHADPNLGKPEQTFAALARSLVIAGLPWIPLAVVGLLVVLRQGYVFAPVWRLLACWLVIPAGLLALGLFRGSAHVATMLPALAVLAAVGLDDLVHRVRRRGWLSRWPRRATA